MRRAKQRCRALPPELECADRACALDADAKAAWRARLMAYVRAAQPPASPVSGRACIELFTHVLLDPVEVTSVDLRELALTYAAAGEEASVFFDALQELSKRPGWHVAATLATGLAASGRGWGPPRGSDLQSLRVLRAHVRQPQPSFELRTGQLSGPRPRVLGLSPKFTVHRSRHVSGERSSAIPQSADAVWIGIQPILAQPMLVDHGQGGSSFVGHPTFDEQRLYAVEVRDGRVDDVFVLPAPTATSGVGLGERLKSAFGSFVQGLAEVPAGLSQAVAIAADWLDAKGPQWMSSGRPLQELATYRFGEWIRETAADCFPADPELADSFVNHMLPNALGNLIGFVAGGGVAAVARGSAVAFTAVAGSGLEASGQFHDAKAAGADDATARRAFGLGVLIGTTEVIPIQRMLGRIDAATGGTATRLLRRYGVTAVEEFVQEWIQTVAGNAVARGFYDEHRSLLQGSLEGGASGGAAAMLFQGIVSGVLRVRARGASPSSPHRRPPTLAAGVDGRAPDPNKAAWFTPSEYTLGITQLVPYWVELQRVLDAARDPSLAVPQRVAHIRHVAEGSNVPHIAYLSGERSFTAAVTGQSMSADLVEEKKGNCKYAAVSIIEILGDGGIATPLQSEYTTGRAGYHPEEDYSSRGHAEVSLSETSSKSETVDFYERHLQEGQLGYLRTGNDHVGHATAVVKLGGQLYSINNQTWYRRMHVPSGQLQTLAQFLRDWESWSANPSAYGDAGYSPSRTFNYEGFTTTRRIPRGL